MQVSLKNAYQTVRASHWVKSNGWESPYSHYLAQILLELTVHFAELHLALQFGCQRFKRGRKNLTMTAPSMKLQLKCESFSFLEQLKIEE
jgi:hypothetical protein